VVDDLVDAADSLRLLLELWGHDVRVEYDGRSALKTARDFQPHLVLLDLHMPGMHGGEVARRIKTDSNLNETWVIATSANEPHDSCLQAYVSYFRHHLVKPYNLQELERYLASCAAASIE
jgi:CheY-like chemotaxis protein